MNVIANSVGVTGNIPSATDDGIVTYHLKTAPLNKGTIIISTTGRVTFNSGEDFKYLGEGENEIVRFVYEAIDEHGKKGEGEVSITITGVNDASVVTGDLTASTTEDVTSLNGSIAINDPDHLDNPEFRDITISGTYGSFVFTKTSTGGNWSHTINNSSVQYLSVGESVIDRYTLAATDGTSQIIEITINGVNDEPVVTGDFTANTTEDSIISLTGSITISDQDDSDNPEFRDITISGTYGRLVFRKTSTGGDWSYIINNSSVQYLSVGESVIDRYTLTATDGTSQIIEITINGVNDALVLSSALTPALSTVGTNYYGRIVLTDRDISDSFSITATGLPAGLSLVNRGRIVSFSGAPNEGEEGDHEIRIIISDGVASVTHSFSLEVSPLGINHWTSISLSVIEGALSNLNYFPGIAKLSLRNGSTFFTVPPSNATKMYITSYEYNPHSATYMLIIVFYPDGSYDFTGERFYGHDVTKSDLQQEFNVPSGIVGIGFRSISGGDFAFLQRIHFE